MNPKSIKHILYDNGFHGYLHDLVIMYRTMYLTEKLNNPKMSDNKLREILFEKFKMIFPHYISIDDYAKIYYINKFLPIYLKANMDDIIMFSTAPLKSLMEYVSEAMEKDRLKD